MGCYVVFGRTLATVPQSVRPLLRFPKAPHPNLIARLSFETFVARNIASFAMNVFN